MPYRMRMRLKSASPILWIFATVICLTAVAAGPAPEQVIMHYLDDTIDWERSITSLDQTPISTQDVVYRETVHQTARQALQLGLQAARAQAQALPSNAALPSTLPAQTQPAQSRPETAPSGRIDRSRVLSAAIAAKQLIDSLHQQLDQVNRELSQAPPEAQAALQAKKDKLESQLNFAQVRKEAVAKLVGFMAAQDTNGAAGLTAKIDDLERTIPDAHPTNEMVNAEKSATAADTAKAQQQFREEDVGIVGLIGELFTLTNRMSDISELAERTKRLEDLNEKMRDPMRTELRAAIAQGEALSQSSDVSDPARLDAQRAQIDALATRFKHLADAAVPLSSQSLLLESAERTLNDWHAMLGKAYWRLLRSLVIRLTVVASLIVLMLAISKLWGKLALRYVTDVRRRRQFFMLRRIVVGCGILLIIIASVVAEFGSLATFAGLITAGIAVSLQTVILSGVAHFFFIGRFGVRVGDRVTIGGVTGDVIEIGLFRIYLMELKGTARDLRPTGRVVVFSNSVLFQPNAFYKQYPGVNYTWHEVALTLAPNTDHRLAENRLMGAVESVYNKYKADVERQYAALSPTLHVGVAPPKLEGRLRLVDAGLEYVIRYPVENQNSADIDDKMTRKLLEAIEKEPSLKLVPTGTPEIQAADPVAPPEASKPAA
jgi:small-conductance mechanosensitive channel